MNIKHIIRGWWRRFVKLPKNHKEFFDARLNTCNECEFLKLGICTECGCIVKAKTKVFAEMCPENKWEPEILEYEGTKFIKTSEVPRWLYGAFCSFRYQTKGRWRREDWMPFDGVLLEDWLEFMEYYDNNH